MPNSTGARPVRRHRNQVIDMMAGTWCLWNVIHTIMIHKAVKRLKTTNNKDGKAWLVTNPNSAHGSNKWFKPTWETLTKSRIEHEPELTHTHTRSLLSLLLLFFFLHQAHLSLWANSLGLMCALPCFFNSFCLVQLPKRDFTLFIIEIRSSSLIHISQIATFIVR